MLSDEQVALRKPDCYNHVKINGVVQATLITWGDLRDDLKEIV